MEKMGEPYIKKMEEDPYLDVDGNETMDECLARQERERDTTLRLIDGWLEGGVI